MDERLSEKTLAKLLYLGLPLVSIFLINGSVTDPVNAPKFFVLGIIAVASLFVAINNFRQLFSRNNWIWISLLAAFVFLSIGTLLTSSAPLAQSLYGVYGRNNGVLTYLFLSFLFLAGTQLRDRDSYRKMVVGLLVAGCVNVFYCGWVLSFGEILSWSNPYGNILGTFGNPNFIGAFLGIFVSVWFAYAIAPKTNKYFKLASVVVLPLAGFEIVLSHAIQGRVLTVAGFALVGFYWIKTRYKNNLLTVTYLISLFVVGSLALAGALQKGPLTSLIYKRSVSLRGQYWLAGWNTGTEHPLTGVGFDSLGDWYRRARDARALSLPGVDTVVNTAHNVPLDIFAFGGWPLFITYIALILYTAIKILRLSKRIETFDPVFVGLVSAWATYQLQSIISINQIGLAVWGWALSGLIIGYEFMFNREDSISIDSKKKQISAPASVISPPMLAGIGLLIGALLAVPPLNADLMWRKAQISRDAALLEKSLEPSYMNPQNTFKYLNIIQVFEENGLNTLAHRYVLEALEFNPECYDSWKFLFLIKNSTDSERERALSNMKRLDPLNPDVTSTK